MAIKGRVRIVAFGCLAIAGVALVFRLPPPAPPQSIRFTGYTNGVVGAVAPVFATFATNNAAWIQRWLDAGTNGAVFTITNQQTCDIWLFPLSQICTEATKMHEDTPLLNAPNFSGLRLSPREVASVEVALLPDYGRWRLQLYYHRDSRLNNLKRLLPRITGRPEPAQMETIESEWISQ